MADYSEDYLLDKKIKIFQPLDGYRASSDAVLLAAAVNKTGKGGRILDAGSGTGAISLCLAHRLGRQAQSVEGWELQPRLAELAQISAAANGFTNVHFCNKSLFADKNEYGKFGTVVTNPPYAEHDMPSPNPSKAAAHNHSEHGLKDWLDCCIKLLEPQGYFYMINRAEALEDILFCCHRRLGGIEVIPLYSKNGQRAKRIIIRGRKDSKAPLIIHPAVTIHEESGAYSPEAALILRGGNSLY